MRTLLCQRFRNYLIILKTENDLISSYLCINISSAESLWKFRPSILFSVDQICNRHGDRSKLYGGCSIAFKFFVKVWSTDIWFYWERPLNMHLVTLYSIVVYSNLIASHRVDAKPLLRHSNRRVVLDKASDDLVCVGEKR